VEQEVKKGLQAVLLMQIRLQVYSVALEAGLLVVLAVGQLPTP
jgi:hypothetical protein